MRINSLCRDVAISMGEPTYFTGLPCKEGHTAPRWVTSRSCTACACRLSKKFREQNPGYSSRPGIKERIAKNKRLRYRASPKIKEADRAWRRRNPVKILERGARRRVQERRATPKWANRAAMEMIYAEARRMGQQTDHVVPLRSKLVCGLHCEANLALLPANDNARKGNRHWPDMP